MTPGLRTLSGLRDPTVAFTPAALFLVIVSETDATSAFKSHRLPTAAALDLLVLVLVEAMCGSPDAKTRTFDQVLETKWPRKPPMPILETKWLRKPRAPMPVLEISSRLLQVSRNLGVGYK